MSMIQLQGFGKHEAVPAKNIQPGDTLVWNFGITSKVTAVEMTKSGKSCYLTVIGSDGETYRKRYAATRMLATERR